MPAKLKRSQDSGQGGGEWGAIASGRLWSEVFRVSLELDRRRFRRRARKRKISTLRRDSAVFLHSAWQSVRC